jgi:hypothetical protein
MMKHFLQKIAVASLLSTATLVSAAPTEGEWQAKFWDDATGVYTTAWKLCIQADNTWYISSGHPGWRGKWFSKGNDVHMQVLHVAFGTGSFDVSSINQNNMTGYYKYLTPLGVAGYYTTNIVRTSSKCAGYVPYTP